MKDIILEVLCSIMGLSAASGIYYEENRLYIVCDDSNYLYTYSIPKKQLDKNLLIDMSNQNERVPKKSKLDLESIFKYKDSLHLLGSMSTSSRTTNFQVALTSFDNAESFSTATLSEKIHSQLGINSKNLNIEGSFLHRDTLYLFNRGNGPEKNNGIILVKKDFLTPIKYIDIPLPEQETGCPAFTDAILLGEKIYFIAAIEQTGSTYEDGQIGGSFFGSIDLNTLALTSFIPISDTHKFEGLSIYREDPKQLIFLLCEDSDQQASTTIIYKLSVPK